MFGAEVIQQHEKYLGLPSLVGKNKCNTFQQLMEGLNNKLSNWKKKLLSHVRKEILIKTVAQAVLTYTMSVFKLPNNLCDEMTSMVLRFWWGLANEKKNGLVKLGQNVSPKKGGRAWISGLECLQFSTIGQTRVTYKHVETLSSIKSTKLATSRMETFYMLSLEIIHHSLGEAFS